MAQFGLSFSPSPLLVASGLRRLEADIRSFRVPLQRSIQEVLAPSFRRNFDVGGRPPWRPLEPETVAQKGTADPLVRSGTLKQVSGQLNIWHIDGRAGRAWVSGLSGAFYGEYHQRGAPDVGIPARPFLLIQDPEDMDRIAEIFAEWVDERGGVNNVEISKGTL